MQMRQMPDDNTNIEYGRGGKADDAASPTHTTNAGFTAYTNHDSSPTYTNYNGSPTHARRPLRTIPLVPLEGASDTPTRKESAQAVWNYVGDTDKIMPVAPTVLASEAELDEAINDENFIQPRTQPMQRTSNARMQRRSQNYPNTGEHEMRQIPVRRRRLVRTSSLALDVEPIAISLPSTAPLSNGPYDRLLPSWELRRKRDTIFLMLLTLLVLSILGIMSCNYLLSLYHL